MSECELLEKNNIANIDDIIRQYMYYLRTVTNDTKNGSDVTTPGMRYYFMVKNKSHISSPIDYVNDLIYISRCWNTIFNNNSLIKVLLKFNGNFKLFFASYLFRYKNNIKNKKYNLLNNKNLNIVIECFIKLFALLELVDTGYSSSKFKSFLFLEEIRLADNKIKEIDIKKDFKTHIAKYWDKNHIKQCIKNYEGGIIVFLNDYLFDKNKKFKFDSLYDVEHIMPSSGRNIPVIRADAGLNEEEFKTFANKIGNKILLEFAINREIGRNWFESKLKEYKKSKCPIAKDLAKRYARTKKPLWKKADIEKATNDAADRIADYIFS